MLILLHGWGANSQDLAGLAPYLNRSDFHMVFPNAPLPHPHAPGGRMWYSLSDEFTNYGTGLGLGERADVELAESRQALIDWIQALSSQTGIPLARMVLGGFSQGGAMTLDLGCRLPFAGLMVMSGYLHAPLPGPDDVDFPMPPTLMGHGRLDPVVPLTLAHQARDGLMALNTPLTYREYDMGHEISLELLDLMQTFMGEIASQIQKSA